MYKLFNVMDFNFDFIFEIKDEYPYMTVEQRTEWFDSMLEKMGMTKYFNAKDDDKYNEAELSKLHALRRCTALFKDVFVNGVTPENKHKIDESQKIWAENNLDQGLDFEKK